MPNNLKMEGKFGLGVIVCVFNRDFSKILLLKRNEEKRKKGVGEWGNIGGRIEFGEMSREASVREAREETGLELKPENLKLIEVLENPKIGPGWHAVHFVYSINIDENCPVCINQESDECGWFSINKLPEKMIDSKEFILDVIKKSRLIGKV
jgi:ADP-ribose pyrophosphatase YjhB (NUDIX family)